MLSPSYATATRYRPFTVGVNLTSTRPPPKSVIASYPAIRFSEDTAALDDSNRGCAPAAENLRSVHAVRALQIRAEGGRLSRDTCGKPL